MANLPNTPQLTPGFKAAQVLPPPLPFECFCGILAKEYILVYILGLACMVFCYCLHRPVLYVAVYVVLYYFAGLGCWSPRFGSFLPLLVLFAGLLPLVSGCWALFYGLCGSFPFWKACFGFRLLSCGSLDVVLVLPLKACFPVDAVIVLPVAVMFRLAGLGCRQLLLILLDVSCLLL